MCSLGLMRGGLFFERGQRKKASFPGRSLNADAAQSLSTLKYAFLLKECGSKKDYEQGFDKVESL